MSTQHVHRERQGRLGIITLDRPARHNALDVAMARELRHAGLELARDETIGAVVIRGTDGVFCSGVDLKYVRVGGDEGDLAYLKAGAPDESQSQSRRFGRTFKQTLEYLASTISEIRHAPKPFVAGIDGVAAAGGLGLALSCDLVVASQRSHFEWAYEKTALSGAEGITFFLPRLIGLRRALDLALLAPRLDAERAFRMGLVSEVWPDAGFDDALLALGQRLAEGPTAAYARTKALLDSAMGGDCLEQHLSNEIGHLVESAESEDFADGLARFFERTGS
jgi:2-(1,2-epoxy-1,2-dihydrophenyl)acetyl-CoA isomerase